MRAAMRRETRRPIVWGEVGHWKRGNVAGESSMGRLRGCIRRVSGRLCKCLFFSMRFVLILLGFAQLVQYTVHVVFLPLFLKHPSW